MNGAPPSPDRARDDRPVLLVLSHLRWDFVFQRPQHLMTRAAATHEVLFFEEPVFEAGAQPRLEWFERGAVRVLRPVLPEGMSHAVAVAAQRALLETVLARRAGRPLVAWYYSPMFLEIAPQLPADAIVYDCMDELSAFRGAPPAMVEFERRLLARADLVFTGGRSLYEAKRGRHASVHCLPSSIDVKHFAQGRAEPVEPESLRAIPRPRIGFFGVVDERMDLELVAELAALRPDWHLCMIGPVAKIDPASLPQASNIHWLGGRDYRELPAYLGHWELGFMPFALNESTRFISPTKTPEFLAAGLPVVSTAVTDVVRDYGPHGGEPGLVEIAQDAKEMALKAEMLLRRPRATWLAQVDARLARDSWDLTWSRMEALIRGVRAAKRRPGAGVPVAARAARAAEPSHV
ncbi:glycosyltransferase family 1 protein [Falsiroseomonas oryziterrae]|uniref:glycosyltransferase family 1 protein n=1 Tax=Falsiroseomonas oryziterrae TaxID=2911368 RepID=UPI001F279A48|nr:glycosyltransferase family 1 protein [Roseomonas sp. NPKOSM-4]